ncbi:hypothetical protein O4G76_08770 [Limimaricola sp. G21655-S1]|uniref:hypothetical protein n=1 Tax=Limimaricola sp. G21655-S1 TaxID=3014768 RepID=UPI0022AF345B|nr:hypothetical protein [Limimaricola sp. G21655-S1]MCZ4260928.1 hypothetical protein [Limimaricola sp. G21655-S1]
MKNFFALLYRGLNASGAAIGLFVGGAILWDADVSRSGLCGSSFPFLLAAVTLMAAAVFVFLYDGFAARAEENSLGSIVAVYVVYLFLIGPVIWAVMAQL